MALREEFRSQGDFLFRYRSYLPVLILLVGVAVYCYQLKNGDIRLSRGYDLLCIIVSLIGLGIRMLAIGYSADHTSGRNTQEGQIADEVNQTGLYSIVRHPLYLGNLFMWLGIAMMTQHFWFILAFMFMYWLYYERIMYAEEAFLIEKFEKSYLTWADGVPAFIPTISTWKKPKYSFSWVKIIRQEKAGILNLFLSFFLIWLIGRWFIGESISLVQSLWFWGFAFALFWYLMIKIIQKTTQILRFDRKE